METNEFVKEFGRMCTSFHSSCSNCPVINAISSLENCTPETWIKEKIDIVGIVEAWSEEHPVKTNRNVLEETFGINWGDNFPISSRLCEWLDQEYVEPKPKPKLTEKSYRGGYGYK